LLLAAQTCNEPCPVSETQAVCALQSPPYYIRGCMLTIAERMDEEFIKMLQACDAHSTEYIVRSVVAQHELLIIL